VIIALVARELAGDRAGLIAALIVAVYPNLWVNDGLIMSESVSAATVALTILLTYRLVRRPTPWRAAWVGVACGLALLTRAEVVLLVPLMIVPAVAFTRCASLKARSGLIAVVLVTTALTALPWVVYNATRFEKPVLLSTGDGEAFLGANCPRTYSGRDLGGWSGPCSIRASTRGDQSVVDAYRRTVAFRYMSDHASRIPVVVAARVGRAWSLFRPVQVAKETSVEGRPQLVSLSGLAMFYLLVPLAIVGVVVLRRRRTMLIPLLAPIVLVTLTAAAVRGEIRFRIPAEVAIVVLAAVATDAILRRWLDARGPRLATEPGR
jgi:4-amino-4-deoxy-L-arabinose transferase-like glycosyltransferase